MGTNRVRGRHCRLDSVLLAAVVLVALAGCDDENPAAALLGGGAGYSDNPADLASSNAVAASGSPITTMSSEFGYVDDPAHGGSGDPGTTGNWYTGAGGQSIGLQSSTGISLPAATEIAYFGSTAAAQNQSVQVTDLATGNSVVTTIVDVGPGTTSVAQGKGVDLTYGTARALGVAVNGSDPMQVTPLMSQQIK